ARYFSEYAGEVVRRLGDRVRLWATHNEPWVIAYVGHEEGRHAPGIRDPRTSMQVAHNVLLSHGEAVPVVRDAGGRDAKVGIVLNLGPAFPATESDADRQAASRYDGYLNRWFLDALFRGSYPEDVLEHYGKLAPQVEPGDMAAISRPIDFLGVNYYTRHVVRDFAAGGLPRVAHSRQQGAAYTEMGWEVYPQGLYEVLTRVHREYAPREMYVTENGIATADALDAHGQVRDAQRISYTRDHLLQAQRVIREGVPLRGYFHWSLMDNFEWAYGYSKRFGLVYVDYPTQRRTVKQSGAWYRDVIARNGVEYQG
ncbi:MAG: family 1 glycosylhydrolase, partial [Chloroflexota bacterium]|nr:family 1 glycosylhydrolase [Chloroflexota bacterium]